MTLPICCAPRSAVASSATSRSIVAVRGDLGKLPVLAVDVGRSGRLLTPERLRS